jgi:hypothetical protein
LVPPALSTPTANPHFAAPSRPPLPARYGLGDIAHKLAVTPCPVRTLRPASPTRTAAPIAPPRAARAATAAAATCARHRPRFASRIAARASVVAPR